MYDKNPYNPMYDNNPYNSMYDNDSYNSMNNTNANTNDCNLCQRFATILRSQIIQSERNLCAVTRMRNINAEILGRPTRSPLALNALFSFEDIDERGQALNLGETVILQEEINPFISALRAEGIIVTALHNHWLFDRPRLMYIHFESIDNPISFAEKVARAFLILERSC